MFEREGEKRASLVMTTAKAGIVIVGLSWLAANWISASADRQGLGRLAALLAPGEEPHTTGSIGPRAAATKFDPCTVPKR